MAVYTTRGIRKRRLTEGHLKKADSRRLFPAPLSQTYDVFLSHSLRSSSLLSTVHADLVAEGYAVYVDVFEDPDMDPSSVSKATAERLRLRLEHCETLVVAYTERSRQSRWVPWELGYADGAGLRVAVLPVVDSNDEVAAAHAMVDVCDRQEFMALYPYVTRTADCTGAQRLYVNQGNAWTYLPFAEWLSSDRDYRVDLDWLERVVEAQHAVRLGQR